METSIIGREIGRSPHPHTHTLKMGAEPPHIIVLHIIHMYANNIHLKNASEALSESLKFQHFGESMPLDPPRTFEPPSPPPTFIVRSLPLSIRDCTLTYMLSF